MAIRFELPFEELVIGIADDVLEKIFLLDFYELHFELIFPDKLKILVDALKPQVYSLRLEMLHEKALVCKEILLCEFSIIGNEMVNSPDIGRHGVLG